MHIVKTDIEGVVIIEPKVFDDERGYFFESFSQKEFEEKVSATVFVQDNESSSRYGVVRGLHFQKPPYEQAKLVRVVKGCVLDVAVDIRKDSPTYGRHVSMELSGENKRQLFIPRGFAHGYAVLSEEAVFAYKCDNYYAPGYEGAILWNDPQIGIDWGLPANDVILSEKDRKNPSFLVKS
ncbi:dTDP-4-dehydrorhamnose 3,5-epimerase [Proteiniphilum sp. UBA5384]|uniref:dTDP-4-dehydrorhamnose 3,5-epimerase n=1 Tax=Proteiniphilum sp. UBA5384 TaxID=1947279 RepID=UPI0025D8D991|nr:dTDP-4-dehydrorhamnose 3,5-epimerase [Proteiniphilum sp. UBA5384]